MVLYGNRIYHEAYARDETDDLQVLFKKDIWISPDMSFLSSELSESAVFATSKDLLHFQDWFFGVYFRSISKSITWSSQSFFDNIHKFNLWRYPHTLYIPSIVEFYSSLEQSCHSAQKQNNDGFWIKTNFLVQMESLLITDFWKESDTFHGTLWFS